MIKEGTGPPHVVHLEIYGVPTGGIRRQRHASAFGAVDTGHHLVKQAGNAGFLHAPQQRLPVDQIDHRFAAQLGLGRDDVHRFPNAGHHLAVIDTHSNLVVAARTQKLVRLEDKRRLPDLIGLQTP